MQEFIIVFARLKTFFFCVDEVRILSRGGEGANPADLVTNVSSRSTNLELLRKFSEAHFAIAGICAYCLLLKSAWAGRNGGPAVVFGPEEAIKDCNELQLIVRMSP